MAIITPAQFRTHYPGLGGTGEDARLVDLIDQADALCAGWAGWPVDDSGEHTLESSTYTVYVDGPDRREPRRLPLPLPWVTAVTSVHSDSDWGYSASHLIDAADYIVENRCALVLSPTASATWRRSLRAQKVVCSAGFAAAPPRVVVAVAEMVRHLLDRPRGGDRVTVSAQGGSSTAPEPSALIPRSVREALTAAGLVVWGSRVG